MIKKVTKKGWALSLILFFSLSYAATFRGNNTFFIGRGNTSTAIYTINIPVSGLDVYGLSTQPRVNLIRYKYTALYTSNGTDTTEYIGEYTSSGNVSCTNAADCGVVDIPSTDLIYEHRNTITNGGPAVRTPSTFDISTNQIINTTMPGGSHSRESTTFNIIYKNQTVYPSGSYKIRLNLKITPTN